MRVASGHAAAAPSPDGLQLVLGFDTSAGEQVAGWAPGAFVFKTLNAAGAGNMARATEYAVKPLMLVFADWMAFLKSCSISSTRRLSSASRRAFDPPPAAQWANLIQHLWCTGTP